MTRRCVSALLLGLALLEVACGDRVLGGVSRVASDDAATGAPHDPCAGYVKGSLEFSGAAVTAYCDAFALACGIGRSGGEPVFYPTRADCESKYASESERARSCSAGRACEAAATATSTFCEGAALGCGP